MMVVEKVCLVTSFHLFPYNMLCVPFFLSSSLFNLSLWLLLISLWLLSISFSLLFLLLVLSHSHTHTHPYICVVDKLMVVKVCHKHKIYRESRKKSCNAHAIMEMIKSNIINQSFIHYIDKNINLNFKSNY